jgi:hypothetical protein
MTARTGSPVCEGTVAEDPVDSQRIGHVENLRRTRIFAFAADRAGRWVSVCVRAYVMDVDRVEAASSLGDRLRP